MFGFLWDVGMTEVTKNNFQDLATPTSLYNYATTVMEEAGGITLAPHTVIVSNSSEGQSQGATSRLDFKSRYSLLFKQHPLMQGQHQSPIIEAELKNGALIHVHFLVESPLPENLILAVPNLLEIDLTDLPGNLNEEGFKTWVLCDADRYWYGCKLYDDLPQVQRLKAQAALPYRGGLEEPATRPAEDAKNVPLQNSELDEEREEIQHLLDPLQKLLSPETRPELLNSVTQFDEEKWQSIQSVCGFDESNWPQHLDFKINGDWVFGCDRKVWQGHIYNRFVMGKISGLRVITTHVLNSTIKHCGAVPWAHELGKLKFSHQRLRSKQGQSSGGRTIWFLTKEENEAIVSPHSVCTEFLDHLVREGYLIKSVAGPGYEVA